MKRVVNTLVAAALVLGGLVAVLLVARSPEPTGPALATEIYHQEDGRVSIAWSTRAATPGRVQYRRAGGDAPWRTSAQEGGPRTRHRVTLTGLEPGTRYRYQPVGSKVSHVFQTRPKQGSSFSFLLLWGAVPGDVERLRQAELPDFILSLQPLARGGADPLVASRAVVPVHDPSGAGPPGSRARGRQAWALDWGGLRLAFARQAAQLSSLLDAPGAHTVGVVYTGADPLDPASAGSHALHLALQRHNRRAPEAKAAFVIHPGDAVRRQEVDGVVYLTLPPGIPGAARLDVERGSVVAVTLPGGKELVLRSAAVPRRRTCKECRRLADRGAYEQSVRAYKEVIRTHAGHFQMDDAHMAVAEILDENLFRYREALVWYRRLVARYPRSGLAPMARQRVTYLEAHSGHVFVPLARFERIRKVELARLRADPAALQAALGKVEAIIRDYPQSTLAPVMIYWLANQHRDLDADRAVTFYRRLISRFAGHERVADARVEIGETYYQARRYGEAMDAFQAARRALPRRARALEAQVERAARNLQRQAAARAAGALSLLLLLAGAIWPPVGISRRRLATASKAFLPLACLTLLGGWLVHEQFSSVQTLVVLALAIPAAACFGYPFAAALAHKPLGADVARVGIGRRLLAGALSLLASLLLLASVTYLAVYLLNEHYLTTFNL